METFTKQPIEIWKAICIRTLDPLLENSGGGIRTEAPKGP